MSDRRARQSEPREFEARELGALGPESGSGFRRTVAHFLRDEQATSDVEYILLTAMVIFPLFAVPPLIMDANSAFFHRVEPWVNLPFP